MEQIVIRYDERLKKMDLSARLRDIGTQIANVLYGNGQIRGGNKMLNYGKQGILGKAQNIKVKQNNLANKIIIVYLPANSSEEATLYKQINNMVAHGKQQAINISVIEE